MLNESSFGVIPLRKKEGDWEVLLIQHLAGHWGFPKGRPDLDLSPQDTARRELLEETGLTVVQFLKDDPFVETYTFERNGKIVSKVVSYFPATVQGEVHLQQEELSASVWISLTQAKDKLTFKEGKALCQKVELWISEQMT